MSAFKFRIEHWSAWSPGLESSQDWQAWAQSEHTNAELRNGEVTKPNLAQFPPMLRRRLSATGKMAVHALLELDRKNTSADVIPAVFCSQYGEVARSVKLLSAIASKDPLSPTDFSLSVHNAVAGVYSIGCHQNKPITAMSAGADGLVPALIESIGFAHNDSSSRCVCVLYDAPLPEPYPAHMNQCKTAYALAMLVSFGDESPCEKDATQFCVEPSIQPDKTGLTPGQSVFQFIRFLLDSNRREITLHSGHRDWKLMREGGQSGL